jgi:two-component system response regulator BaeR
MSAAPAAEPPPNVAQPPARILIVEDEPKMARLVIDYLRAAGHSAQWLADGREVEPAVRADPPDLVLLDLMLPGLGGLDVCRALRAFSEVPIVMLTARADEADRLEGLDLGADDYICKTPFSPREIVARIRAILRRSRRPAVPGEPAAPTPAGQAASAAPAPSAPALRIDDRRLQARYGAASLDLTPVEFRLLRTLAASPGRVFTRDQLLDALHGDGRAVTDRAVDSHVKNLRRKLAQAGAGEESIRSVYGVGYKFGD